MSDASARAFVARVDAYWRAGRGGLVSKQEEVKMGVGISDLRGVGPVMARRLDAAGFGSVEDIAGAGIERLMQVPGVGPHVAVQLQAQARELAAGSSVDHDDSKAEVARSVKRLREAIPDLARSKKQASRLKKSTKRMAGWVGDLDQRSVRKQFMAEVTRVSDGARKGTASKKDAKTLRKHATHIENAVRKVG